MVFRGNLHFINTINLPLKGTKTNDGKTWGKAKLYVVDKVCNREGLNPKTKSLPENKTWDEADDGMHSVEKFSIYVVFQKNEFH